MNIDSPRFGSIEIEPSRIIEFPFGLAGFEDCHRFTLFHPEGQNPRYFILQSLDDEAVAFHISDPAVFGFNYEINLSDEESAAINLIDPGDAAVVVILAKGEGSEAVRANLKAPLIINLASRRGLQHVFFGLQYNVTLKGD